MASFVFTLFTQVLITVVQLFYVSHSIFGSHFTNVLWNCLTCRLSLIVAVDKVKGEGKRFSFMRQINLLLWWMSEAGQFIICLCCFHSQYNKIIEWNGVCSMCARKYNCTIADICRMVVLEIRIDLGSTVRRFNWSFDQFNSQNMFEIVDLFALCSNFFSNCSSSFFHQVPRVWSERKWNEKKNIELKFSELFTLKPNAKKKFIIRKQNW